MSTPSPKASLTQAAYERLRSDLLNGRIKPGSRLKTSELCESMSTNLSTVREALSRLSAESLVVSEPQRGFRAAPVSAEDLLDLTQARIDIEILCLRRSIELGTVAWEASVLAAHHAMSRTPIAFKDLDPEINRHWWATHEAFHDTLCSGCDNKWLLRIRRMLSTQGERYRMLSAALQSSRREAGNEHVEIVDAVLARDADRAASLMAAHLKRTSTGLLAALERTTNGLPATSE